MELRPNLELVSVEYESGNQKAVLTFLDRERKQVRVVNFNRQIYKDNKYVDDADKAAKVDEWCKTYFDTTFKGLAGCIGTKKDVYISDRFNSLWEIAEIQKFTPDMVGQIYQTEVKEIVVDDYFIRIRYLINNEVYESKQTFGNYLKETREWFQDPNKKQREYEKFERKYQVPVDKADTLIGHPLMVEVKTAFGSNYYGDIKAFPRKK